MRSKGTDLIVFTAAHPKKSINRSMDTRTARVKADEHKLRLIGS
ncbi:MAG: hypothetical protein RR331_07305 [Bacteroides sp.]